MEWKVLYKGTVIDNSLFLQKGTWLMFTRRMKMACAFAAIMCSAIACQYVMPERYVDYHKGRVPVNLPRGVRYSDVDHNIEKSSAVIITLTNDGRIYFGTDHSPLELGSVSAKITSLIERQRSDERIVFLAVDAATNYGEFVEVCDRIRNTDVSRAGLLVSGLRDDWPSRLTVDLPAPPQPEAVGDVRELRPNPLTLVVTINSDLTVLLNQDPIGSVSDLSALSQKLHEIFKLRTEQRAYRSGAETLTNVPESERIEKTLTIKAPKRLKYGDVVKVIDAVKAADASPIVLQLDDLSN
jgi:biopolymer transport protein ExbD